MQYITVTDRKQGLEFCIPEFIDKEFTFRNKNTKNAIFEKPGNMEAQSSVGHVNLHKLIHYGIWLLKAEPQFCRLVVLVKPNNGPLMVRVPCLSANALLLTS